MPSVPTPFMAVIAQIAKFMGPTWGPPGSCWPHGPCSLGGPVLLGVVMVAAVAWDVVVRGLSCVSPLP